MIKSVFAAVLFLYCTGLSAQQVILKSKTKGSGQIILPQVSNSEVDKKTIVKPFEPTQFKSLDKSVIERDHEVVMVGKVAPSDVNIYEIALFGGYQKTLQQLEEDESFLNDCDRNFETREKGSYFFSDMGWQYLSEGSKEMATYRYNLAYLLNPQNVDVFWGLGVIEYQKGEFEEAIKLMTMGLEIDNNPSATLMVDLATVHIQCFSENNHASDLQKAYHLLDRAIDVKPDFTNAYMQLSLANLINGKIDEAWMSFHKGYDQNPDNANYELLSKLLKKRPDPLGIFK